MSGTAASYIDNQPLTLLKVLLPWPSPALQERAQRAVRDFLTEADIAQNY